jgi:hypothetical protein
MRYTALTHPTSFHDSKECNHGVLIFEVVIAVLRFENRAIAVLLVFEKAIAFL